MVGHQVLLICYCSYTINTILYMCFLHRMYLRCLYILPQPANIFIVGHTFGKDRRQGVRRTCQDADNINNLDMLQLG